MSRVTFCDRRKVRTSQGRVLVNDQARQLDGKCNRKQTAFFGSANSNLGKDETVR